MKLTVALRETTAGTGNIANSMLKPLLTSPTNNRNRGQNLKTIAIMIVTVITGSGIVTITPWLEPRQHP